MQLARVRGNVVASIKAAGLASHKLLLLEPVAAADPLAAGEVPAEVADDRSRELYVAVDLVGAGVGEVVLVTLGSAARVAADGQATPTDAAVVAIVDAVQLDGRSTFDKH